MRETTSPADMVTLAITRQTWQRLTEGMSVDLCDCGTQRPLGDAPYSRVDGGLPFAVHRCRLGLGE